MEKITLKIVIASISLLLAIILIPVYASMSNETTKTTYVANESLNIASTRVASNGINESITLYVANRATGWRAASDAPTDCLPGYTGNGFQLRNQTGYVLTGGGTDYTVANDGSLVLKNVVNLNSSSANTTYVTYRYCGPNYVASSWGRSTQDIGVGLLALIALAIAIASFYSIYKDVSE